MMHVLLEYVATWLGFGFTHFYPLVFLGSTQYPGYLGLFLQTNHFYL